MQGQKHLFCPRIVPYFNSAKSAAQHSACGHRLGAPELVCKKVGTGKVAGGSFLIGYTSRFVCWTHHHMPAF